MIQRDPQGAFGPAMAVFDTARTLKTKNLAKYTLILEENFKRLAGFSPSGRIEFCAEVLHSKEQATPRIRNPCATQQCRYKNAHVRSNTYLLSKFHTKKEYVLIAR